MHSLARVSLSGVPLRALALVFWLVALGGLDAEAAQEDAPALRDAKQPVAALCADPDRPEVALLAPRSGVKAGAPKCCKVCVTGKACGDSCINHNKACTKPPGCACDDPNS